ncbi:TadE/TadG family type IV pilus assembly protein [Puniceibacterium sp. IMCC21224]|uniref:TadE/TadG family type IV pilus assembly protein n=1 Tax=Puniceibacterium sp. IMCC21224 TaxID=1618204 RepID=UPI00065CD458|nr:TadE/TadG family type IV pilus assembly protein [Puniceibacterium sp. IMCC21224]KMK67640.1 TadE-like protein [Puniceibacterium sp. IMCC21224]
MLNGFSTRGFIARFRKEETGSLSVEVAIWTPLILASLLAVIDFSHLMVSNASMWNAARNTARAVSVHRVRPDDAERYLRDNLFFNDTPYIVSVQSGTDEVVATVSLNMADVALTPIVGRYLGGTMIASISMLKEPE